MEININNPHEIRVKVKQEINKEFPGDAIIIITVTPLLVNSECVEVHHE